MKYDLDIICLQENKIKEGIDINLKNARLITFTSQSAQYGNGFLIRNSWTAAIHRMWQVSDRICVLQIATTDNKIMSIINVYGPTSVITKDKPKNTRTVSEFTERDS